MRQCNCPRCNAKRQHEMKAPIFEEDRYFEEDKWYPDDKEDRWYPEDKEDRWYPEDKKEEKRPEDKKEECPEDRREEERPEDKKEEERPERRPEKRPERRPQRRPEKRPEDEKEEKCKVVYEPTVYCTEEKEFHHCVKHIVPIVCKKVENHHFNHEYVIDKKVVKEEHRFDHGKRKEDWCKVAGCKNCHKEEDYEDRF